MPYIDIVIIVIGFNWYDHTDTDTVVPGDLHAPHVVVCLVSGTDNGKDILTEEEKTPKNHFFVVENKDYKKNIKKLDISSSYAKILFEKLFRTWEIPRSGSTYFSKLQLYPNSDHTITVYAIKKVTFRGPNSHPIYMDIKILT